MVDEIAVLCARLPLALAITAAFLAIRGHYLESAATQRTALAAAARLDDTAGQAVSSRLLADSYSALGDYDQVAVHYANSLTLYRQLGGRLGEAKVHRGLSLLGYRRGQYADALGHAEQALRLYQAISHKAGEAETLNDVGFYHGLLGDFQQARTFCQRSLTLNAEIGDRILEGYIWDSLGYAEHQLGNLAEAAACYQRALSIARELGDRPAEAVTLTNLGDTQHDAGELPRAQETWQLALTILDDLRHPNAAKVRDKLASTHEELARSIHPEKVFAFLPGMSAANLAALYGLDEPAYAAIRDRFAAQTAAAARDLLAEPEFGAAVDRLPFSVGQTLAVIGESTTDAADSWLEILGHLIMLRRPADAIKLVNAAISGYPTTMLQRVMSETLQRHRPSWVAIFAGANDVLRYGTGATKPLVTGTETARNLAEMRRQAAAAGARVIWMTPTARDSARIAAYPPFQGQQIWLEDDDLSAVDDAIRATAGDGDVVVDLSSAFRSPPDAAMLSADGLHPTLAGQKAIAKRFAERLAASSQA